MAPWRMTMAARDWLPRDGRPIFKCLQHSCSRLPPLKRTKWKPKGHLVTLRASSTATEVPINYEGFLRQKKHERSVAERNNQALIVDMLTASATKRDARAYLKTFGPQRTTKESPTIPPGTSDVAGLNLGRLYRSKLAATAGTHPGNLALEQMKETLHIALVKIRAPHVLDDAILRGVMHTLEQLSHLGMQIVVIVDCDQKHVGKASGIIDDEAVEQVDRIMAAIGTLNGPGARKLDSLIKIIPDSQGQGRLCVSNRDLLLSPLKRGRICVVAPSGFNSRSTINESVSGNKILLTLTREFAGISTVQQHEDNDDELAQKVQSLQSEVSIDRIIVLDPLGGTPHKHRNRAHRYINLEQEYDDLLRSLTEDSDSQITRHADNLSLMKSALAFLPSSSSGFITTPSAVAKADTNSQNLNPDPSIGTRSQRNLLIHNLLTNKPAVSFSLPQHRQETPSTSSPGNVSTLFKRGMPLTVIPPVPSGGWTCPTPEQGNWSSPIPLGLRNPQINYPRLTHLINDSFGRTLDIRAYSARTANSLAGIIIAGDYQGAAIFTWESPPPGTDISGPNHPWVPYLDKFAVLRSAQGTATADVLWNAMTKAFPGGFCWRSRTVNPVNKWYFERSQGSLRLEGTQWTMFWSQRGVIDSDKGCEDWSALLGVCESVVPSWKDPGAVD